MVQKRARKRNCGALNRYPLIPQDNAFLFGSELRDLRLQLGPRAQPLVLQYARRTGAPGHHARNGTMQPNQPRPAAHTMADCGRHR